MPSTGQELITAASLRCHTMSVLSVHLIISEMQWGENISIGYYASVHKLNSLEDF